MNILEEKRRALGVHRLYKGGSETSNASSNETNNLSSNTTNSSSVNQTSTTNNDRRLVLQDATAVGDGSSLWSNSNTQSWSDNDTQTTLYQTTYAADADVLKTFSASIPDAVRAMGSAGAGIIAGAGGAVVDLNRDSINANSRTVDSILDFGSSTVDRAIDALFEGMGRGADLAYGGMQSAAQNLKDSQAMAQANIAGAYGLASKAVDSFTPTENKNADIGKYAMLAAAAVCALVFLKDAK